MDTDGQTLLNAIIGAVATTLITWIPFSPIAGGLLAGYLQGGDVEDGALVGGLSGLFAALPSIGILLLILVFLPFAPDVAIGVSIAIIVFVAILAVVIYWVGLSLIGGIFGVYLRKEIG